MQCRDADAVGPLRATGGGVGFVFAWALEAGDPYPPAEGSYVCEP